MLLTLFIKKFVKCNIVYSVVTTVRVYLCTLSVQAEVRGISYLLVTEECGPQAPYIIKVLERNHADVAQLLHQMAAQHVERKSLSHMLPLCGYFKAFGYCRFVLCLVYCGQSLVSLVQRDIMESYDVWK